MARYTLIIGNKNSSSWSLRPWLALRAAGVPFEEILIPLGRDDSSRAIKEYSAAGRVPVLKIEEGGSSHTVWDSLAICETLAERHPEARLWPEDQFNRGEARSYAAEMHSGFPDLRAQLPMDFVRTVPTPDLRDATKSQIARIIETWMHALEHHSDERGYLFGGFSIADCMYAPVVTRFRTYGVAVPSIVQAYCDRIFALPAMKDWEQAAKREVESGLS